MAISDCSVSLPSAQPVSIRSRPREFSNFGGDSNLSERNTVKLLEPVLTALGVRFWRLETEGDLAGVAEAFSYADKERHSAVLIVGAPTGWN